MGKLPFKASEGVLFEILRSRKDFPLSELKYQKGVEELLCQKVRLEASPNGSPMSVLRNFCDVKVDLKVTWSHPEPVGVHPEFAEGEMKPAKDGLRIGKHWFI
jgi:hypothetical protein